MKHIEIISKARQKGMADIITQSSLFFISFIIKNVFWFLFSKKHRVSSTSCPGGIWSWSPRGSSQSQRWASLPQEADWDTVPLHPAPQGHRLQVTDCSGSKAHALQPYIYPIKSQHECTAWFYHENSVICDTMQHYVFIASFCYFLLLYLVILSDLLHSW